tara:strand:+ start:3482 stop:3820 length:339 start_codon:yes stop_codon:yes gene_type:complete
MNIKTIDVNALTWFDKVNGNSYFSGKIVLNQNLKNEVVLFMPFQYGYGSQYEYQACKVIGKYYEEHANKITLDAPYKTLKSSVLWKLKDELKCEINSNIEETKRKKDLYNKQ